MTDVRVIEKNQAGSKDTGWERIAGFPHDQEHDRDSQRSQQRRESPVGHVWHVVFDVGITNVIEEELSAIANKPTNPSEQEFSEGRVHIEEVEPLKVV